MDLTWNPELHKYPFSIFSPDSYTVVYGYVFFYYFLSDVIPCDIPELCQFMIKKKKLVISCILEISWE